MSELLSAGRNGRADDRRWPTMRGAASIAVVLALALDFGLLRPLLTESELDTRRIQRVYYEASQDGVAVLLDRATAGYISDFARDSDGNLAVPAGRTVAIRLEGGQTFAVKTTARGLAPYVVVGTAIAASDSIDAAAVPGGAPELVGNPVVAGEPVDGGRLSAQVWNAGRPWAEDRQWLAALHESCRTDDGAVLSLAAEGGHVAIRLGSCSGELALPNRSGPPILLVAAGPYAAAVSDPTGGWPETRRLRQPLVAIAVARIGLLAWAVGAGPTALASAALYGIGLWQHTAAALTWWMTLPLVLALAAGRLVARVAAGRGGLAWTVGCAVLAMQVGGLLAAVVHFDVGSFGNERITRDGDDSCALIGYSTVRGDSLRYGSEGVAERLADACAPCRGRTARFAREAQTLRWVRETACRADFPPASAGHLAFLGGGNDDLFYRPAGVTRRLGDMVGLLRFLSQPIDSGDWEVISDHASRIVAASLTEQADDIAAIGRCGAAGGRRFWFIHDFLIWDLERGRTEVRAHSVAIRRDAVNAAGGTFIDLLDEFRDRAGVAWMHDFIHPSGFAQRQIADLLCQRIAVPSSAAR